VNLVVNVGNGGSDPNMLKSVVANTVYMMPYETDFQNINQCVHNLCVLFLYSILFPDQTCYSNI
jgi:hypothetical protein